MVKQDTKPAENIIQRKLRVLNLESLDLSNWNKIWKY